MTQLLVESIDAIKAEGGEMINGVLLSQAEVAKRLGVSDKTIRNWMPEIRWIYYWCEDALIQNGQFTRQGLYTTASFQKATRSLTFSINMKTGKLNKDRSGKTKTEKNKNRVSTAIHAQAVWALNKVEPNSQPFVSDSTSPEVSTFLSDHEPEVIEGQLEEENVSTLMVFETKSYAAQLAEIEEEFITVIEDGKQSMKNFDIALLRQNAAEGTMLGKMAVKFKYENYVKAQQEGLTEAFNQGSDVTDQLPKQAMKRQTKKI